MRKTRDKLEKRKTRFHKPDKWGRERYSNTLVFSANILDLHSSISAVPLKTTKGHSPAGLQSNMAVKCLNKQVCSTITEGMEHCERDHPNMKQHIQEVLHNSTRSVRSFFFLNCSTAASKATALLSMIIICFCLDWGQWSIDLEVTPSDPH